MENGFEKLRNLSIPSLAARFKLVESSGDGTWRSLFLKEKIKKLPIATLEIINKNAVLREMPNSAALIIELAKGKSQKYNQLIKYFSGSINALKGKQYISITSWQEETERVYPSLNLNFDDLFSSDKMYPTGQGLTLSKNSYGYSLIRDGWKLIYNLCIDHLFERDKAKLLGKPFQRTKTPLHKFWKEYTKPVLLAESQIERCVDEGIRSLLPVETDKTWKREVYPIFMLIREIKLLG